MKLNYIGWTFFILFAVSIGLYPLLYFIIDMSGGLLSSKTESVLHNKIWNTAFYTHISFGGLSLLTGWSQFSKWLRNKNLLHRWLGKIYLISVLMSGSAGLYIAFYATGGMVSSLGFGSLAIAWLTTTTIAYISIRQLQIEKHQQWMIRSFALAFAAVTLRLWIPSFQVLTNMEFVSSYKIIAWLCWTPNLVVSEWIIRRVK
ncbi:MAG: DUF2306 domain-containing protein [Chryseolinea sp.]